MQLPESIQPETQISFQRVALRDRLSRLTRQGWRLLRSQTSRPEETQISTKMSKPTTGPYPAWGCPISVWRTIGQGCNPPLDPALPHFLTLLASVLIEVPSSMA